MSRRIILGRDDQNNFNIRVSLPGYDARIAGLDELIFDANHIAPKTANSGEFTVAGSPHQGRTTRTGSGITDVDLEVWGSAMIIAIARPWTTESGNWEKWIRQKSPSTSQYFIARHLHEIADGANAWTTPHKVDIDSSSAESFAGWGYNTYMNGTKIQGQFWNDYSHTILVKWRALRYQ